MPLPLRIPFHLQFPALVDPDVEDPRDHKFVIHKSLRCNDIHYIMARIDGYPIMWEIEEATDIIRLVHTPLDVDTVHPALYKSLRPRFEYEGSSALHPAEAATVGEAGPEGTDACFLPTFGRGGPLVPYVIQQVFGDVHVRMSSTLITTET